MKTSRRVIETVGIIFLFVALLGLLGAIAYVWIEIGFWYLDPYRD
jgi:hypothetical protein